MNTGKAHIARSAMLTEYLRYIWSRPSGARSAMESFAFQQPLNVSGRKLPGQQSVLASNPARRTTLERASQPSGLSGRGILGLLMWAIWLVILGAPSAQAQTGPCPETNLVKYIQPPNLDGGLDVWDSGPWALADDFICTNTGPITDIHIWGSWLNDIADFNTTFWLAIYDDVPATNGPVPIPSRPGTNLIWQQYFGPGQYSQSQVGVGIEQFYNPEPPAIMGPDSKVFYYCFYPTNPPVQQGTATQPKIYWLAVYAMPSQGTANLFGWKSTKFQRFDISTHTPWPGGAPITTDWRPTYDPQHVGLDLAFKITTSTNEPPCCPETNGVKWVQRPQVPGGMDVKASQNLVLADDFRCSTTGPITDLHIWGSWLQDNIDPGATFTLSIWSDVPKQTNGTQVFPSHPGVVLWTQPFGAGEYYQCLYTNMTEPFYDPSLPAILGGDSKVYYLCFYPTNPFVQQGTAAMPTNYWLSVNARTATGSQLLFGWHTSFDHYNDIAVWGNAPFPAAWNPMFDLQGNPLSLAFKVTTQTNPCPPGTIICPTNKTVECGSVWNFDDPRATNACCGTNVTLTVINTTTNGTCPRIYTRTWLVTDCSGFTMNCSQSVTNVDTTPPYFIFCPTNRTVECGSSWGFDLPVAADDCCLFGVFVLDTYTNGTCPELITRVWLARDCCGNTNTCSQTITNLDTTPPSITCAPDKTVPCGSLWTFDPPTASDRCCSNPIVKVLSTFTNGICPVFVTQTWVAYDCCGNSNTCSQTVTLVDTIPPVLTCSSNKTVECGTPWTFDPPTATDNCCTNPIVSVVTTFTNGVPCHYIASRIWIATDCCQNQSTTCTQRVSVVDTLPPRLVCPSNMFVGTCTTNAVVTWTIGATDDCSTNITVTSTPPSGTTFLRGTTNNVHVTATDGCGNTNTCDFIVTVQRPSLTITHNGMLHTITLTWPDGILQHATNVLGPYSDVPLATSPYTTSAIGPHRFYRLRCP
jgi:hypothetical protein